MKKLAAELDVARYAVAEHALEIGIFYLHRVIQNPKRRELTRNHLIDQHLLDGGREDDEEILRAGELHYSSKLLALAKDVVRCCQEGERALAEMKRKGNLDSIENFKRKIYNSAIKLADFLYRHPLDEESEEQDGH